MTHEPKITQRNLIEKVVSGKTNHASLQILVDKPSASQLTSWCQESTTLLQIHLQIHQQIH